MARLRVGRQPERECVGDDFALPPAVGGRKLLPGTRSSWATIPPVSAETRCTKTNAGLIGASFACQTNVDQAVLGWLV
ncbi:MAG: hypothetical protein M5U34_28080 [Chloroflexi bacterium]|nr:hypothetical protein [Chloroflexota bacterium]